MNQSEGSQTPDPLVLNIPKNMAKSGASMHIFAAKICSKQHT